MGLEVESTYNCEEKKEISGEAVGGDTIMMLLFLRHFVGKKWLGTERERERGGTWRPKLSRELTLLSHPTYKRA